MWHLNLVQMFRNLQHWAEIRLMNIWKFCILNRPHNGRFGSRISVGARDISSPNVQTIPGATQPPVHWVSGVLSLWGTATRT